MMQHPDGVPEDHTAEPSVSLPAERPLDPSDRRAALCHRIEAASYTEIPVVNAVPGPKPGSRSSTSDGIPGGDPVADSGGGSWWSRWRARRRARRAIRRWERHPEAFRVNFTDWVPIPWRDRPIEARLADFAVATASRIERTAAWRHTLLESHRIRLTPRAEAADIACRAYRLHGIRRALGERPTGPSSSALQEAQREYDEHQAAWLATWNALLDRVLAFDDYCHNLTELEPQLSAIAELERLRDGRGPQEWTSLLTAAAADDLTAGDTAQLASEVSALKGMMTSALGVTKELPVQPPDRDKRL